MKPSVPLLVATTNRGKLQEYRELLADLLVVWHSLADVGLGDMDVEETGDTFLANALLKAQAYSARANLPTLADDSGICVDALGGAPGVYSARYAPDAEARIAKLLTALHEVPYERRGAHFVCVTALVMPDGLTVTAEGVVTGSVGTSPRGAGGFGYDPIFVLPDGRTMAELTPHEKHEASHRGVALRKIQPVLHCLFG